MNSKLSILLLILLSSSYCIGQSIHNLKYEKKPKSISSINYAQYPTATPFKLGDAKKYQAESVMLAPNKSIPIVDFNKAFFCRIEHKLTSSAQVPLRMRVGDIDYVNFLEGKNVYSVSPRYLLR